MKKILVALLFTTMSLAMIACGKEDVDNTPSEEISVEQESEVVSEEVSEEESVEDNASEDAVVSDNASVTILADVWNAFDEAAKFPAMGGDYTTMVDGAPGAFDVSDAESLASMLYVPAELAGSIDEAASLFHGMNLNTFTGAALHLTDASGSEAFINALKENIMGTQWMCGFPDTLVMFTVNDEYVVYAFGNVDAIASFKAKVLEVYGENAILVVEESLAG